MFECFVRLEQGLVSRGLVEDARWLQSATASTYTTSCELSGEVGAMLQRIYRTIPSEHINALQSEFDECQRAIQIAWPQFSLQNRSA
jgi:hypothetical protein